MLFYLFCFALIVDLEVIQSLADFHSFKVQNTFINKQCYKT